MNVIWSKLSWKGDYSRTRPLCFANQWIVQDIPSLSSKSEQAEMLDNHWFGIYSCTKLNYYQQTNKEGGKFAGKGLLC